jgi:hypothetical protein
MTGYADLWNRALSRWVRLANLWTVIETVFGIAPAQAIRILRIPLEAGEITALVPGWRNPRRRTPCRNESLGRAGLLASESPSGKDLNRLNRM